MNIKKSRICVKCSDELTSGIARATGYCIKCWREKISEKPDESDGSVTLDDF